MPVRYVLIFESSFVVLDAEPGMSVLAAAALIAPIAECACGRKCLSNVPAPRHSAPGPPLSAILVPSLRIVIAPHRWSGGWSYCTLAG